jgi:microcystin-dependent protein
MSQYDFGVMDPHATSGIELADELTKWRDAVASWHRGPVRPTYVVPGQQWIDDANDPVWGIYYVITADNSIPDVLLYRLDMSSGAFIPDAAPPSGPAGGDLAGTFPNPTIKVDVALTGNPTAPTPAVGDSDTSIATSKFVHDAVAALAGSIPSTFPPSGAAGGDLSGSYPNPTLKADVALQGNPTVTAPPVADNDTSIPNTAWVNAAIAAALASAGSFISGMVMDFAGAAAPPGWLLCQGQSVLRADYPTLFTAIGTTYGSVDGTHFNVPDLGGRVTAGKEAMATRLTTAGAGIDGSVLGATGGAQTYVLLDTQVASHVHSMQSHGHSVSTGGHAHGVLSGYSILLANAGNTWGYSSTPGNPYQNGYLGYTSGSTDAAGDLGGSTGVPNTPNTGGSGSGLAHQNTQPTIIMNKIIKT